MSDVGLEEAYAVDGPDANRELYASWAATYETGFVVESRYVYHQQVAAVFLDNLDAYDQPVLDVGCGTGVVGEELVRLGVSVIDGVDISPEMLAKAQDKAYRHRPVYRTLVEADLTGPIEIANNSYDGIVSAGAFTHGHLGPQSLSELLRVARPGATCAIGINSAHFEEFGFGDWLTQRHEEGCISDVAYEMRPIYDSSDPDDPNAMSRIAVFTAS